MSKALKVLYEARQGKDFIALAKEYSDDPAAKKDGGDLGNFKRGEMLADLEKAILPLKTGYHSFRLTYCQTGRTLSR